MEVVVKCASVVDFVSVRNAVDTLLARRTSSAQTGAHLEQEMVARSRTIVKCVCCTGSVEFESDAFLKEHVESVRVEGAANPRQLTSATRMRLSW